MPDAQKRLSNIVKIKVNLIQVRKKIGHPVQISSCAMLGIIRFEGPAGDWEVGRR